MHPIIYDVAVSLDGFIAGDGEDISLFAHEGPVVEDYMSRLQSYSTAIMGRSTYEFGYKFGMEPGQNPYPHMKTIVFSETIELPEESAVTVESQVTQDGLSSLRRTSPGPIYLCGGGRFASSLLKMNMIDTIILKRAPIILGSGIPLFDAPVPPQQFIRTDVQSYANGYLLERLDSKAP